MDGNEQVGLVPVGYLGPLLKFHSPVAVPGHDDLHVRIAGLDLSGNAFGDVEHDVLLQNLPVGTGAAGIPAPVTGVDDDCRQLEGS